MQHGDRKRVNIEGVGIFEVEAIQTPGWAFSTSVIVPNQAIQELALKLLPGAEAMAKARAARLKFLSKSRESLAVAEGGRHTAMEEDTRVAADRLTALTLLAKGLAVEGSRNVTLGDWLEILAFFHQDFSVGSQAEVEQ